MDFGNARASATAARSCGSPANSWAIPARKAESLVPENVRSCMRKRVARAGIARKRRTFGRARKESLRKRREPAFKENLSVLPDASRIAAIVAKTARKGKA